MSDEIVYTWNGVWNEGAGGWYQFFGGDDGLPPRDLTAADVAGFNDVQLEKLNGPDGKQLYKPVAKKAASGNVSKTEPAS